MKIIGTSQINKAFFLVIGTPIISLFHSIINSELKFSDREVVLYRPLIFVFLVFVGEFVAGCFELIRTGIKCKRRQVKKTTNTKRNISVIRNTQTNLNRSFPFFVISFMALIDFTVMIMQTYMVINPEKSIKGQGLLMVMLIVTVPSTYCIWDNPIYRHHILALVLLIIANVIYYSVKDHYDLLDVWFVVSHVVSSIRLLLEKWVLKNRNTCPFLCLSFQGLIGLIITSIIITLSSYANFGDNFHVSFQLLGELFTQVNNALLSFCFIIFGCLTNVMVILINQEYNPNQTVLTNCVASSLLMFYSILQGLRPPYLIWEILGNVLTLCGAIVYNEIIIFYYFGMEFNTRKEIHKRSEIEINDIDLLGLYNEEEEEEEEDTNLDNAF